MDFGKTSSKRLPFGPTSGASDAPVLLLRPRSSILLVAAEAKAAGEKKPLHPDFKKRQNEGVWGGRVPPSGLQYSNRSSDAATNPGGDHLLVIPKSFRELYGLQRWQRCPSRCPKGT